MAYDKNTDYQKKINEAIARGDYSSASEYEKQRNEKIDAEGLKIAKTNNYQMPYGVSNSAWAGTQETHKAGDAVNKAQSDRDTASNKYAEHTNKDMISSGTLDAMNQSFTKPTAVKKADAWLSNQLQIIQSGKTSYSDQVRDMLDKIMNREKFSYDVDNDPLFQQALASAMKSGKQAMQDTIGQASALTGGYGSTYATSAGNQAFTAFIEDAYDNLPQYYQMARDAYDRDGEEMYRQFGMVSELDDKEFNRNLAAYDATYQHRNALYNEEYTRYRDDKSDAFAMAGIEMQKYAQESNDLYNLYTMASDTYESMYEKDYRSWADKVNNAWKQVEVQNTDAWANKNFDEGVRQYEESKAFQKEQFEHQKYVDSQNIAQGWASINERGSGGGGGDALELTDTEIKKIEDIVKNGGTDADILDYLYAKGKAPTEDEDGIIASIRSRVESQAKNEKKANTPKSGTVSNFRSTEGDNFKVKVNGTNYTAENHGKVTDEKTLKNLKKLNVKNDSAFLYNGDAYVLHSGGYYKIGARLWAGGDYENLISALGK